MRAIRPIRSARIRTIPLSSGIARPSSFSCTTTTSLAFVNSSWQKVIVVAILRGKWRKQQHERKKGFLA
jgi:DNA-binding HxlR family transcriptional regulator